ncbi:MAG: penicillin-binding protein 2 [Acidimicrobiales bacterium]|nr:penicillin-binding protein 2 [Acidimicrobiales bacterium]MYH74620.1 penicillin-binding protein 2 [Acidimicrobiales bacterium]MYK71863.1 penicillin-binding protein 2 [Acidimicrobiales bacterium]
MTDVLEHAERRTTPASWHPSMGAPPGLRSSTARTATRRPDAATSHRWHPSSGAKSPPGEPRSTLAAEQIDRRPRQRTARAGPPRRRALLLIVASTVALATLGARLVQVQVLDRETYAALGERQGTAQWELESVRGAILDRNLNLLAVSDNLPTVWADPRLVTDPYQTAAILASVLDVDADVIAERLASDRHFVYVARQVSPEDGLAVQELQLAGIGVRGESSRLRPNGDDFARGLLGATDIDQNPLGGAEKQFAEVLDGTDGREVARIAQSGMPLPTGTELFEPVSHGDDVVLTLHTQMQWVAERSVSEAVRATSAEGGMVVVMQTDTGDVLALAAVARDPETGEVKPVAYNPAYTDAFEPGSVAKSFTVATALEAGLTTPVELHSTPARYTVADKEFIEPYSKPSDQMTTSEILVHSSNIGTIKLAERIGASALQRSLRSFGFGRLTGADEAPALPGESRGILRAANQWRGTDLATIAFGQGIAMTAIQLAAAYNAIANDGVYVTPRLVLGSVGSNGALRPADPVPTHRVLSEQTAQQMQAILADVVRSGTGKRAAIDGYQVAGKTGTAQKPSPDGGYSSEAYTSSFAGFLPADRPELTVVVVLDEPDEYRAAIVAAPVFAEVAEYALRMLQVSPDA